MAQRAYNSLKGQESSTISETYHQILNLKRKLDRESPYDLSPYHEIELDTNPQPTPILVSRNNEEEAGIRSPTMALHGNDSE